MRNQQIEALAELSQTDAAEKIETVFADKELRPQWSSDSESTPDYDSWENTGKATRTIVRYTPTRSVISVSAHMATHPQRNSTATTRQCG